MKGKTCYLRIIIILLGIPVSYFISEQVMAVWTVMSIIFILAFGIEK